MKANNIISNCIKEHCHNDDKNSINLYLCSAMAPYKHSLSLAAQLLSCSTVDQQSESIELNQCFTGNTRYAMENYNKHSIESFYRIWQIQCTIMLALLAIATARAFVNWFANDGESDQYKTSLLYIFEFIIISLSVIVSVNVANPFVELIVLIAFLLIIVVMWYTKCWQLAEKRNYDIGQKPACFTLIRSSINIITAVCILAVDFQSFPKEFRKTRRYGVGLMDVGIGMFVFSMGLVASRPRKLSDLRKSVFTVGCLLILGLVRTLVIAAIDYHQDEHEYGTHLNAFFTLGLTKLFATLFGFFSKSKYFLLKLGIVIVFLHEVILQYGVWQYVMNPNTGRTNFINSNREGLCSLPGFIGLYLLAQHLGKWLQEKDLLNFEEIKIKLRVLSFVSLILWLLVTIATFLTGIARVTCNMGYVLWILAISITMLTFFLFLFNIVLDTLIPVNSETNKAHLSEIGTSNSLVSLNPKVPLLIEAVNFNGLTFFLLANILTGCTNIFFDTDKKTNLESVVILFIYMLITTTFVFILYRLKIKIA